MIADLALIHVYVAGLVPECEAIIWGDRAWTHTDLVARSRRRVNALHARGLGCQRERGALADRIVVERVERVVKSDPAVYDALVVGLPSARWAQAVTAVVSLQPGATPLALETAGTP